MVPLDHVFVLAILLAPPGVCGESFNGYAPLTHLLRDQGRDLELLDSREANQLLVNDREFAADVRLLQSRFRDLADAPHLWETARFPNRQLACEMLEFNRVCYRELRQRREAFGPGPDSVLDATLDELEQLYRIWDLVRDAASDCYALPVRRKALANLRRALGEENYYQGIVPPHVPVWRFQER